MNEIKEKSKWETIQYISKYIAVGIVLDAVIHIALRVWKNQSKPEPLLG